MELGLFSELDTARVSIQQSSDLNAIASLEHAVYDTVTKSRESWSKAYRTAFKYFLSSEIFEVYHPCAED